MAMVWACLHPAPLHAQESLEYRVKAAFLYNFTKFVGWPKEAFETVDTPLSLCVAGENPFGGVLEDMLHDRTAQGRVLLLRLGDDVGDPQTCQVVFVPRTEDDRVAQILQKTRGRGVLTVGESQAFADAGGMIRLVLEDKKVRFDVNVSRAGEDGLKVSSQLLKLARSVSQ